MTGFRQLCTLLFFCLALAAPLSAAEPACQQLQQENLSLQRQVHRLESQVAALREELNRPGAPQIIGGIGYIVGLFGVVGWFAARKKKTQED